MSKENKIPPEEIPLEQPLNNEPTDELIPSAKPFTEAEQSEIPPISGNEQPITHNPKLITDDMEVHHHTHPTHGKKTWKDYFWDPYVIPRCVLWVFGGVPIRA